MTKAQQNKLLGLAKSVLYARRNGSVPKEQAALDKLQAYCEKHNLGVHSATVVEQARIYLAKTSIAAHMNSIV